MWNMGLVAQDSRYSWSISYVDAQLMYHMITALTLKFPLSACLLNLYPSHSLGRHELLQGADNAVGGEIVDGHRGGSDSCGLAGRAPERLVSEERDDERGLP